MAENTKKWEETGRRYRTYIKLEKRLSENTVESYMRDLRQFAHFILRQYDVTPRKVERTMIERSTLRGVTSYWRRMKWATWRRSRIYDSTVFSERRF